MNPPPLPRAPAALARLATAEQALNVLAAQTGALVLEASEGGRDAEKALAAHRSKIDAAQRAVVELRQAAAFAEKQDRLTAAADAANIRADQLVEFKAAMADREQGMAKVLAAVAAMAAAYGEYSAATVRAQVAVPSGTAVPAMSMGPEGLYGPAWGPCERLVLSELFRLAPQRQDGAGRLVMPFARAPSEMVRYDPGAIPAGIDEFRDADKVILADIEKQIERLNAAALDQIERKEAA